MREERQERERRDGEESGTHLRQRDRNANERERDRGVCSSHRENARGST